MSQELDEKTKAINALVELCIKKGWRNEALAVTKKVGVPIPTETINELVSVFARDGDIDHTLDAAAFGNRKLTTEEIDELVNGCVNKENLEEGLKAAKMGASKEGLKPLIEAALDKADIGLRYFHHLFPFFSKSTKFADLEAIIDQ